jgi:hypothetical protein
MLPITLEQSVNYGLQEARHWAMEELGLEDPDVQPHIITMTREVKDSTSSYIFSPAKSDKIFTYDTAILDNDAFLCVAKSFGMVKARVVNGVPLLANAIPYTYADPSVFTGPAVGSEITNEQEAVDGFFSADLTLVTNKDKRLDEFHTSIFYEAPTTQVVTAGVKTVAGRARFICRSLGGRLYKFIGGETNKYTLTLKADSGQFRAAALTGANGYKNYVQLALIGYKINGGSSSIKNKG